MNDGSDDACGGILLAVPLFPLPNVVLFPRAILPLHIFEERYKTMMADALTRGKRIAMALLKPGWEKNYHCRAAIEPVVCVGAIVSHERLADGKYNILLQGQRRCVVANEVNSPNPYRSCDLRPLDEPTLMEIDLCNERLALTSIFSENAFSALPLSRQFLQMLASTLPTADIADLIAFKLLESPCLKQKLLSETDPRRRVQKVICALDALRPAAQTASAKRCTHPSHN